MTTEFLLCDVFADRPFAGNPLAVFVGDRVREEAMPLLAREFGWSEITFVESADDGNPPLIRIWTPTGELPFAGHPTVGTCVVLAAIGRISPGRTTVRLGIGNVEVEVSLLSSSVGEATMTQREPRFGAVLDDRQQLAGALDLDEVELTPDLPAQVVSTGLPHLLIPIRSIEGLTRAQALPALEPILADLDLHWAYLFTTDTPGTSAAARARLIAPGNEDAATGSAAGPLGAYLVRYGLHRAGTMEIEQGIEIGRPSRIRVDVPVESGEIGAVRVGGTVHIWGRGRL